MTIGACGGSHRGLIIAIACTAALILAAVLLMPLVMFASGGFLAVSGTSCSSGSGANPAIQPVASQSARGSIPADYLALFQSVGKQYKVPWVILAGDCQLKAMTGRAPCRACTAVPTRSGQRARCRSGSGERPVTQWGGAFRCTRPPRR